MEDELKPIAEEIEECTRRRAATIHEMQELLEKALKRALPHARGNQEVMDFLVCLRHHFELLAGTLIVLAVDTNVINGIEEDKVRNYLLSLMEKWGNVVIDHKKVKDRLRRYTVNNFFQTEGKKEKTGNA